MARKGSSGVRRTGGGRHPITRATGKKMAGRPIPRASGNAGTPNHGIGRQTGGKK